LSAPGRGSGRLGTIVWVLCIVVLHAWFFQGGGWNQNARFDTVRAIVERGSFEITDFAHNTGDVVEHDGRLYANKPPGQALIAAPVYFALHLIERAIGWSPDDPLVVNTNAYLLTWFTSGLPASAVVVLLALVYRRRGASLREALLIASAFATGSLLLPYAGMLMAHNLTAFLLFAAWVSVAVPTPSLRATALAGALLGLAILTELLAVAAGAILVAYVLWGSSDRRRAAVVLVGPIVGIVCLLLYNQVCFGDALTTGYTMSSSRFASEGMLFGIFDWPEPARLYWLTFHPFRGLLYCCPIFLIPAFAALGGGWRTVANPEAIALGAIVGVFVLFNLSFNGWTGGWGVGPRYLIPALPFLFVPALAGWRRLPWASATLTLVSTLAMLCISAVLVMVPGPNDGVAADFDPLWYTMRVLALGKVSVSTQSFSEKFPAASGADAWDSWNLAELIGLVGWASLIPTCLLAAAVYAIALRTGRPGGVAREAGGADGQG